MEADMVNFINTGRNKIIAKKQKKKRGGLISPGQIHPSFVRSMYTVHNEDSTIILNKITINIQYTKSKIFILYDQPMKHKLHENLVIPQC
jgi:hypothetical protein